MFFTIYHSGVRSRRGKEFVAALFVLFGLIWLAKSVGNIGLLILGIALGVVFHYFSFGFAGFWRQAILERKTIGMRSHLLLLAIGAVLFFPSLALLPNLGFEVSGAIRPLGLNVLIGAFVFGVGMTLVGSCSSGTLRQMGALNWRFYYVFLWMIIGGTVAAAQMDFWLELPTLGTFSAAIDIPWYFGLLMHLAVILGLYYLLLQWERSEFDSVEPLCNKENRLFLSPLVLAALLLAILNYLILLVSQYPWAISWIFPKLGILGIQALSLPIDWEFWEFVGQNEVALSKGVLDDSIMLTSLGMVIGVSLAFWGQVFLYGKEKSEISESKSFCGGCEQIKSLALTAITGALMGYGAVIAFGCNVGGFFSGIISGSLHGWLWMFSALLGMTLTLFVGRQFRSTKAPA
ncbi:MULTISPECIES: YeeE/YedE thiosulfate transporter family protein [Thiomicrorhabdus]|uniref:YeeE/YedE family protein n=1 Tax=Thiomicrorhabdus heinhorstiae TaxID=2748010 RepID=A0ABS0BV08_9GAMM|nr:MULTISPECIES: YeeE/YedE thiosulfate transporter family protein [Thiomicrorhabdus]MBF6057667.1 YeeE/YedE family protein [Thiomicrorhabdus heinhorstiae]